MKDLNKQLKFDIGCELKVTLKEWKPEETNYGIKNVYYSLEGGSIKYEKYNYVHRANV